MFSMECDTVWMPQPYITPWLNTPVQGTRYPALNLSLLILHLRSRPPLNSAIGGRSRLILEFPLLHSSLGSPFSILFGILSSLIRHPPSDFWHCIWIAERLQFLVRRYSPSCFLMPMFHTITLQRGAKQFQRQQSCCSVQCHGED